MRHSLSKVDDCYGFKVPLFDGEHVTDDTGTGFVHTAPGHGREDFDIWMANGRQLAERGIDTRIPYTVDEDGFYTKDAPGFEGKRVITEKGDKGDANEAVIQALIAAGNLVARGKLKHQYPHSWRSKKPVIFRNTPQWFIAMDKTIAHSNPHPEDARSAVSKGEGSPPPSFETRAAHAPQDEGVNAPTLRSIALDEIARTQWVPAAGENRIRGMVANRPDWVVSRQRAWGVPIAVFVRKSDGEILKDPRVNARIIEAFEQEGADAWYESGAAARFLAPDYEPSEFERVSDVLDVWFDRRLDARLRARRPRSLRRSRRRQTKTRRRRGRGHVSRRLRSASRMVSIIAFGKLRDARPRAIRRGADAWLHARREGPQDVEVARQSDGAAGHHQTRGRHILRLWAASVDHPDDQRIGPQILKTVSDNYRKLRNTIRWMLGTLAHYDAKDFVGVAAMEDLERLMLHRLAELDAIVRDAYAAFDYARVVAALSSFLNTELSAFYFDIRKDALYCDPPSSEKRKASRGDRNNLPQRRFMARAHSGLHGGRGVAIALRRRRIGASRTLPPNSTELAR